MVLRTIVAGTLNFGGLGLIFAETHWLDSLRFCATCGQLGKAKAWLCEGCLGQLLERLGPLERQTGEKKISHIYLFPWSPGDLFMDRVVLSLKGAHRQRVLSGLALLLANVLPPKVPHLAYPSKGRRDHAEFLAKELGRLLQAQVQPVRQVSVGGLKQASLGRAERGQVRFETQSIEVEKLVIVDDVVTTGATWRGLWRALGEPPQTLVASLFFRKSL